jgi:hypothetical protein
MLSTTQQQIRHSMFAPSCGICFSRKDVRKLTTTAESLCNIPNNLLPKIEQTRESLVCFLQLNNKSAIHVETT